MNAPFPTPRIGATDPHLDRQREYLNARDLARMFLLWFQDASRRGVLFDDIREDAAGYRQNFLRTNRAKRLARSQMGQRRNAEAQAVRAYPS